MIRVFLVDDHTILREGLQAALAPEPGLTVVGVASNGQELLDMLPGTPADVVVLDVNMPVLDGLATTRRLREEFPNVRILILSMVSHERNIAQLLDAGASGFVLKSVDKAEIVLAIQTVAVGKAYLCSELGLNMLRKVLSQTGGSGDEQPLKKQGDLSNREREVLQLIAEGLTTNEIAEKLFTSKRTIETHRQNIIEKTQVKNTAALIKYAMENGLIKGA
ncbi:DNA-binding NarL/FixJ family response regulator [Hymenobacter luteus]|uniref:DNA-binding NarL/FixJ family response regulator n=2 Tax=Hymenobacter TaxID=89966 RepID=A0A7W9WDX1_9BACT|nr:MULTISPECIES: response regulator transcription factor [Hymenobacter]MBB4603061.1 DNA-binding NarL/FixJ family response regulator [Hymenobacter latericoloratus]MBB6060980.1 DNA-binding NarL/FixJ family response regulator [Hymenobacter luteus]